VAHRKFGQDVPNRNVSPPEPITFDLADEKDIRCRERVNGKLLIELVGKVDSGNPSLQTEGILAIFDVAVRVDDGDDPDHYTGKKWDRLAPFAHHTQAELDSLDEDNDEIQERNDEIRTRNDEKLAEAREKGEELDEDSLEELEPMIQPGIDPTSSHGRLNAVLNDPNTAIEVSELAEVVGWLVEQYTGRPTRNASSSRGGSSSINRGSRRARRSRVAIGATQTQDG
jgi:hypothetical protein